MSKMIVTHKHPDLDAIMSVWLLYRFDPTCREAEFAFVPAGTTYKNKPVDSDWEITYESGAFTFEHNNMRAYALESHLVATRRLNTDELLRQFPI